MQLVFGILMVLLLKGVSGEMKSYNNYHLLETSLVSEEKSKLLREAGRLWDFWKPPWRDGGATIFLSQEQLPDAEDTLKRLAIPYDIEKHDIKSILRLDDVLLGPIEPGTSISFKDYYNIQGIHSYLNEMAHQYPKLVYVRSAGRSTEDRDLKYVKISDGSGGDAAKSIVIDAAMHARERIGPPMALYIIHELVEKYETNKDLLQGVDWYILPVTNPDGFEFASTRNKFWRKTRSKTSNPWCPGTDINRNFNIHWGEDGSSNNPCFEDYAGERVDSEPETQAVRNLILDLRPRVVLYLNIHCFGQLLLHSYGYTKNYTEDHDELLKLGQAAADAIKAVNGTTYTVGPISEVIYTASGACVDWAKDVGGVKYSYGIELPGPGFHLPASDILPIVTETFQGVRVLATYVRDH